MAEAADRRNTTILFAAILGAAVLLRIFDLDARPLHSDEGVNWHFLEEIKRTGIYPYSHQNYHGPAYFWLDFAVTRLLGDSVAGLRAASILCGTLLCLLPLLVRKTQGLAFVLLAVVLLTISPGLIFHSRYGIHEMLFLLFYTVFGLGVFRIFTETGRAPVWWAVLGLAGLASTKETFVINAAAAVIAALLTGYGLYRRTFRLLLTDLKTVFISSCLAGAFLSLMLFSSGLRSFTGVREIFLSIPQWIERGTKTDPGHFKPFWYYLEDLIWVTEPHLVIGLLMGLLLPLLLYLGCPAKSEAALPQVRTRFGFFLFLWAAATLVLYSAVSYKTPWLVINATAPAVLFLAWLLARLLASAGTREAGALAAAAVIVLCLHNTVRFNYRTRQLPLGIPAAFHGLPYGEGNPLSYVHTSPGTLELVSDIKKYWERNPNARILVGTNGYWPMPYYLREKSSQAGYFEPKDPGSYAGEYDVIVVDHTNQWQGSPWPSKYLRLSEVTEAYIYFKPLQ